MAEVEKVASESVGVIVKLCLIKRLLVVILGEKASEVYTTGNGVIQPDETELAHVALQQCDTVYEPSVCVLSVSITG